MAGKTGTSEDLRDSWFAGFTGDRLAVVWLGHDDNKPVGMTGAAGAMIVWGRIMQGLNPEPLELNEPPGIAWSNAQDGQRLPFVSTDTLPPTTESPSASGASQTPVNPFP